MEYKTAAYNWWIKWLNKNEIYFNLSTDTFQGFISGFAKGMVGTVTKPAIGLLDLASSTSLAVRDTSKKLVWII